MPQKHIKEKNCIIISIGTDQFVSTSEEHKRLSESPKLETEARKDSSLEYLKGEHGPTDTFIFQLLASELKQMTHQCLEQVDMNS